MKLPFIKWFPADWMADTAMLSPSTRGIWFDLLNVMWQMDHADKLSGTLAELARAGRCDVAQMRAAIDEITRFRVANVGERDGIVTVVCRRFKRDKEERIRAREGMRVTRSLRKKGASVTPDITEDRRQNGNTGSVTKCAGTPAREAVPAPAPAFDMSKYPQSVEEVLEIASDPRCAVQITREQAERYFLTRDTADWVDAARRRISPGKVYGDLRKWALNDNGRRQNGGAAEEPPPLKLPDSVFQEV